MNSQAGQEVLRAKIVMVGAPDVGKTSLVRRFVHSTFSDEYTSTLGVKVDRKLVVLEGVAVAMVLWDMHGETEGLDVPPSYLRGASAALGVYDATRPETAAVAASLLTRVRDESPNVVVKAVANKCDLVPEAPSVVDGADFGDAAVHFTSALSGDGVEFVFDEIARSLATRAGLA